MADNTVPEIDLGKDKEKYKNIQEVKTKKEELSKIGFKMRQGINNHNQHPFSTRIPLVCRDRSA